jgi:UDPglucose 6-dehydrogenase
MVDLVQDLMGGSTSGGTVGVFGAAFKPNSDDVRDSPSLAVAKSIYDLGAKVTVYDPVATDKARQIYPELEYAASAIGAARDADVLLLLTEWPEFRDADPEILGKAVSRRNIVDGRNVLDPDLWRGAGWNYCALGRPPAESEYEFPPIHPPFSYPVVVPEPRSRDAYS